MNEKSAKAVHESPDMYSATQRVVFHAGELVAALWQCAPETFMLGKERMQPAIARMIAQGYKQIADDLNAYADDAEREQRAKGTR